MRKVLFIFGTRPEAIKMAPLINEFQKDAEFEVKICVTAQHREMLDQVLSFFSIIPDYDLDLMTKDQSLSGITSRILTNLDRIYETEKPDLVFVQGDTTTAMTGSLSAFYKKVKVAHLEAGLRTGNKYSPFPEELNRVIAGHIADFHFAPTDRAIMNLDLENIKKNVYKVGNTVIDALYWGLEIVNNIGEEKYFHYFNGIDFSKKVILITGHRRESFGEPFKNMCDAIKDIAEKHTDVELVYPVHLNPNVRKTVFSILGGLDNIHLLEPLDYPHLIWIMNKSHIVLTDSGGIQEEAPALGKPVLVMRDVTERQEGIDAGTAVLVGTSRKKITEYTSKLLEDSLYYNTVSNAINPYGDGTTSKQIVDILRSIKW